MSKILSVLFVVLIGVLGCDEASKGSSDVSIQQECVMNGLGAGSCQFTNTGQKAGAICGRIRVHHLRNSQTETSGTFCSGQVQPSSTTKTEFSIPAVRTFCDGAESWTKICAFEFIRQ